jgi:hypothetical protein
MGRATMAAIGLLCALVAATAVAKKEALGEVELRFGKLILTVGGSFSPTELPKHEFAPITLRGHGELKSVDGSVPPRIERIVVDFDRNGRLQTRGLPVCPPGRLEATTVPVGRKRCADALVGAGKATALVAFPEQAPFRTSSAVSIFNGPPRSGDPTAILHAYTTVPVPTAFVVVVRIQNVNKGRYGYEAVVDVPTIAGGAGRLVQAHGYIRRLYEHRGRGLSYTSARCADGRLQARGEFSFDDGSVVAGSAFRPCTVRD